VQGIGTGTITIVPPGSLQAVNASTTLPEGSEIYALEDGQAPRKLWASKDDIVYALSAALMAFWPSQATVDASSEFKRTAALPTSLTSMRSRVSASRSARLCRQKRHRRQRRQHRQTLRARCSREA